MVEDVGICIFKSVQRGRRIHRLHKYACKVRIKLHLKLQRYLVLYFSFFCFAWKKIFACLYPRSFHPSSDGQTESEAVPAYGQPGLDYSLQRHPARDPLYSAHHMMQHPATVATASKTITAYFLYYFLHIKHQILNIHLLLLFYLYGLVSVPEDDMASIAYTSFVGPQQPRPSSTQNVYQSYETTQSPIAYGSPGQQSASSSVLSRIQKPANTSPTPQAWAIGRQVPNFSFFNRFEKL